LHNGCALKNHNKTVVFPARYSGLANRRVLFQRSAKALLNGTHAHSRGWHSGGINIESSDQQESAGAEFGAHHHPYIPFLVEGYSEIFNNSNDLTARIQPL
jgi:hypothetical protein